ncbi:uncharacterized protein LOC128389190 [Panonychus citri]|uniref:uncharacterized protein LOC128389190 n=1 Tax=Panonychus citri TaxID=50023 RepID=UPI002307D816|nr:uncharacterized protein LOC128389190 [Panonychus citri]XP_053204713.1 uncharacterized protein LOC128389190 [Panonychus citri]
MTKQPLGTNPSKSVAHPPWVNPCNLPIYISPTKESQPSVRDIYEKITRRASTTKGLSENIRQQFIKFLGDEDFESGVIDLRLEWLPEVQAIIEEFEQFEEPDALRKSFKYLQYFAVGLEQINLDQVLHDGSLIDEFREIEDHLRQLLCELQLGMWYREISPEDHIGQEIMAQEYRDISDDSRRLIRDYLLVRDLSQLVDQIKSLFLRLDSSIETTTL